MPAAEQIPVDALDDETARTPAWEELRKQQGDTKANLIPRGTYEATLVEAAVVKRRDGGGFVLRMVARTDRLGRYVLAWRGLSEDPYDPYALTDGQVKGLRKFATSMGISTPASAQEIVGRIRGLLGEKVDARVVHTPVGPQATLSRDTPAQMPTASTSVVDGQVVDVNGEIVPAEGAAAAAFVAHGKLMHGLGAARLGFAQAAEGCHDLLQTEGWLALGFESLSEYLASPEITISRTDFYRLAQIYRAYVLTGGVGVAELQGAGPSKLEVPLPALEQGVVSAEQAAADAGSMTRSDLRAHYRGLLGSDPDEPEAREPRVVEGSGRRDDGDEGGDPKDPSTDLANVNEAYRLSQEEVLRLQRERQAAEFEAERKLKRIESLSAEVEQLREREPAEGVELVLGAARSVTGVLRRVLVEIGDPKQKRMGKELRAAVLLALDEAREHGLDVEL